jgi:hypothetical protein
MFHVVQKAMLFLIVKPLHFFTKNYFFIKNAEGYRAVSELIAHFK